MTKSFPRVLLALAAIAVARFALGLCFGLIPDEVYYWTWSLVPDWCYWDQPGGIAWLHVAWGAVFGSSLVSLRALAAVCGFVGSLMLYGLARRTVGKHAAGWTALVAQAVPLFAAGAVLVLHDSLLMPLAAAAWWLWAATLLADRPRRWPWVGVLLAAVFYAKFSAALLGVGLVAATLVDPVGRRHLRTPWPYLGAGLATLLVVPVALWNAAHRWVAFHAVGRLSFDPDVYGWRRLASLGDFVVAQLGVVTPVLGVLGVLAVAWAWGQRRLGKDRGPALLVVPAMTMLAYFVVNSLRAKIQGNWPVLIWLGLLPLAAAWALAAREKGRNGPWRAYRIGVVVAVLASAAVYVQALTGVAPLRPDMTDQAFGWADLARHVDQVRRDLGDPTMPLATRNYQTAAELRYHLPGHPEIFTVGYAHRGSQFTLWQDYGSLAGRDVLFVEQANIPGKFSRHFATVSELAPFQRLRGDRAVGTVRIFRAEDFSLDGPEAGFMADPVGHHLARLQRRKARKH